MEIRADEKGSKEQGFSIFKISFHYENLQIYRKLEREI